MRRALSSGTTLAAIILVAMYIVYMYSSIDVLTTENATDLLNNAAPLVISATGLTLVIVVGGFDLSLGGVVTLANVILATQTGGTTGSAAVGVLLALLAGVVVGALNGFLVAYLNVQSIAATLGTFIMCSGLALVIMPSPGGSVPEFISPGLISSVGPVPVSLLVILACVVAYLAFRRTRMGIHIFAVGLDESAAIQSGIKAAAVKFRVYLAAGLLYAVAGVMLSALTASGDPNGSAVFMVLVFAAVAIGGAKFGGGRGSAIGSILGAGVLAVLQKMLFAVGVSTFYTGIFQGAILIVAVLIGMISLRLGETRPRAVTTDQRALTGRPA
ncbi:ABC transporter permease [Actinomadura formosensis]|uniref:ABC transporter permease n=1 Tax=Actinomadura formosensis TaxID=60706 RepID=UPI0008313929|nr:ABC transporter permease [Actinomadura formosensis]